MWIVKPFMHKEQGGLEGRTIDIGNVKVQIRNAIAEGGFSCVYLARDVVNPSKQYGVKHMICGDGESLEIVMKEISVLKMLKGHPNVVGLVAHSVFDMGRTKEAFLVMEYCEKSLVAVLENRGVGYFEEKQIMVIFRDVCNAVFAMHGQSPPIAHRDLKAENVLLGADGAWKLCDFGSTSTNHKCFSKPEEMGIEEDNIRKHTTPAYRAPEMWDLYRKEVISEKVDIWALGCLLYRICYFKSAFDGESKLQILNGNYRIPELPKYSASITSLIKDLLGATPDIRPDITQVWFRVNELLPPELQKHLPDGSGFVSAAGVSPSTSVMRDEGAPRRNSAIPRRSPPPPPSSRESDKEMPQARPNHATTKTDGAGAPVGAFWSTQHAAQLATEKSPVFDEEPVGRLKPKQSHRSEARVSPSREQHIRKSTHGSSKRFDEGSPEDFEIRFFPTNSTEQDLEKTKGPPESIVAFQNEAFNSLVAEFDTSKLNTAKVTTNMNSKTWTGNEELEAEVVRLKELLKNTNLEKAEITAKYEKLSAICRSQRQEIQELKQSIAATTPSPPSKDSSKSQISPGSSQSQTPPREKIEGTVWELQQEMFAGTPSTPSPEPQSWQAFAEEPKGPPAPKTSHSKSVRTISGQRRTAIPSAASTPDNAWGFGQESFSAAPGGPHITRTLDQGTSSQRFGSDQTKKVEVKQPGGWAGF